MSQLRRSSNNKSAKTGSKKRTKEDNWKNTTSGERSDYFMMNKIIKKEDTQSRRINYKEEGD